MTEQESIRQSLRLSTLPGWDKMPPEGREELQHRLRDTFALDQEGTAAIDYWLDHNRWLPTPFDFQELADRFRATPGTVRSDRRCEACGGSGFKPDWELVTYTGYFDRNGLPESTKERITFEDWDRLRRVVDGKTQVANAGVCSCHCAYGQHLRELRLIEAQRQEDKRNERRRRNEDAA